MPAYGNAVPGTKDWTLCAKGMFVAGSKAKPSITGKRRRASVRAGRVAAPLIDRAIRRRGFIHNEVVRRWSHIVGTELALVTVPNRLTFPRGERRGATLTVRVEPAFAPLLQHRSPFIIEQVNRYFGYGAVEKLSLVQGRVAGRPRAQIREIPPLSPQAAARLNRLLGGGGAGDGEAPFDDKNKSGADENRKALRDVLERLGRAVYADSRTDTEQ